MQLLLPIAVAAAACALGAAAPAHHLNKPVGFNDAGHDPRAIMRGAGNYEATLKAHGARHGRGYERLKPRHASHKHLPHVHDYFNFTGTTDGGFLDMRHNAIVRNTTINTDDYLELLTSPGVVFVCAAVGDAPAFAPLPAGTAPYYDEDHKLVRNNIRLTLTLPAALGAAGAETAPALEHLRARLMAAASEHTSIAFGFELMAAQPAFASGAECAAQVPFSTPYFAVVTAPGFNAASPIWVLTLTPATPMDLFFSMDTAINFDPNVERAHARRLSAGLHLGADVRSDSARRLASFTVSSSNGVNWNSQTGANAAAAGDIDMLQTSLGAGVLVCKNCYAYYAVSFSVSFQFCVAYYVIGYGSVARDTTNFPVSSTSYTPQAFPDCAALGTQQAVQIDYNFGLEASAQFAGEAGLNLQFTSVGFSGRSIVPQFELLSSAKAALAFGSILPLTIVPVLGLDMAANISASLPPFSMGASARATVGLGGKISLPSMWTGTSASYVTNSPTFTTYRTLTSSFTSQPFTIDQTAASSSSAWGGSASISLIPWYQMNVFSVVPIRASPVYTIGASMWTQGTQPPARLLREGGARQLAGGCIQATANANTGLSIGLGATTVGSVLPGISSTLASIFPSSMLAMPVTPSATLYSIPSIGSPFSISTPPCPSSSPTPSPSAGAVIAAAPPASGDAGPSSTGDLPLGAIIGGAVGAVVAVVILAAGITYCMMSQQNKAKLTAAAKEADAKGGVSTTTANPTLVVRAVTTAAPPPPAASIEQAAASTSIA